MISFLADQQASQDTNNILNGSIHLKQTHQKATSYIQKWWRKVANQKMAHLLSTAISHQMNEQKSFEEVRSTIQNPTIISSTQKLLGLIDRKTAHFAPGLNRKEITSVKVFLSAFLIVTHSEKALGHQPDKALLDAAKEMINEYEIVCKLLRSHSNDIESIAQKLINFNKSHCVYVKKFAERQVEYKKGATLELIENYLKMELLRNKITANNPHPTQREIFQSITHWQKGIFDEIFSFAGNEGVDLLYKELEILHARKNSQMTDLLCDETMKTYYEIATNPNFEFSYTPNSPLTEKIVEDVKKASQSGNFSHLIAYLLGVRKRVIEIIPHATTFASKLRQDLNPATLKDIVPRLADPDTFQSAFLYVANIIRQMESIEHDSETDVWINEVLGKVQAGQNPFSLLADIFRTIHNKIDQISAEYKNTLLRNSRAYWKKEATGRLRAHFEARLNLYDLQLNKTKAWITRIVENPEGLTQEMLCSKNAAAHVMAAGIIDHLHISSKKPEKELIDQLLVERFLPPYHKIQLYKIKINMLCLELFCHIVHQFNGNVDLNEITSLHHALSVPIDERQTNPLTIAKIVLKFILRALKKQNIILAHPEQLLLKIKASLASTSRPYKIVSQSIKQRLNSTPIHPETFLMEEAGINQIKKHLNAIRMNAVCLEILYSILQKSNCIINLEEVKDLHDHLANVIEADPANINDISDVFMKALASIFKKNNRFFSSYEIAKSTFEFFKSTLINSLMPSHRISQAVMKKIDKALHFYLYKGTLPEGIQNHPFYHLLPLERIGNSLREIGLFNLAIHEERYHRFIQISLRQNLFRYLNRPKLIENPPILLKNEVVSLKNIHSWIVKIALIAASLTIIRKQVWHSTPYLWQNDKPMPILSDADMKDLIEEYKVKTLLDPGVTSSHVYLLMEKLLDDVLDDKKINLARSTLKEAQEMLKNVADSKNKGYQSFHCEIVNMIKSEETLKTENVLKFFTLEINTIGSHLQQLMEKAIHNAATSQEELPFMSALPKEIKTGPERLPRLRP
jgi:hypothetical protein